MIIPTEDGGPADQCVSNDMFDTVFDMDPDRDIRSLTLVVKASTDSPLASLDSDKVSSEAFLADNFDLTPSQTPPCHSTRERLDATTRLELLLGESFDTLFKVYDV